MNCRHALLKTSVAQNSGSFSMSLCFCNAKQYRKASAQFHRYKMSIDFNIYNDIDAMRWYWYRHRYSYQYTLFLSLWFCKLLAKRDWTFYSKQFDEGKNNFGRTVCVCVSECVLRKSMAFSCHTILVYLCNIPSGYTCLHITTEFLTSIFRERLLTW